MLYTFAAGIRILDQAVYSTLSDAERGKARESLFAKIQSVVDAMGSFETQEPAKFLASRLADKSGAEFGVGAPLEVGTWYYINPATGERVCVRSYVLMKDGKELIVSTTVGQKELTSGFFVQQTAIN